ncbi:MAG: hypothetical protein BWY63_03197 [Chloroflexi bacterium ADurb.Bin360]|nr:MAG: hypothetical protein BWY63_03197 [Chloroflexi bacterium ADurb.Bin360]
MLLPDIIVEPAMRWRGPAYPLAFTPENEQPFASSSIPEISTVDNSVLNFVAEAFQRLQIRQKCLALESPNRSSCICINWSPFHQVGHILNQHRSDIQLLQPIQHQPRRNALLVPHRSSTPSAREERTLRTCDQNIQLSRRHYRAWINILDTSAVMRSLRMILLVRGDGDLPVIHSHQIYL